MSSIRVADRYALDREIGRGGSGAVWLARDEVLGRQVALKRIGLPPGASASELARAEREARLAARVTHPNVISVFDFVNDGDAQWLVTEYVDGTTFAQTIRARGGLRPDEAAPVLLQAADALAAAHRLDVVHRDVKPSNILIARDGTVKLSDFGIARGVADASLTQTGLVTGSPAYLAPEIATGASASPTSDVWSFGATIFHALAGRPPYEVSDEGGAVLAVLYQIAHEPPPRLDDAGWLAPLLERTMEPDPGRRASMSEVAAFLRAGPQGNQELATQVLPAVTPTSTAAVSSAPAASAPAVPAPAVPRRLPAPAASTGAARHLTERSNGLRAVLAGVAAVAVFAVIGALLLLGGGDDDPDEAAAPGGDTSATTSDDTSGSTESTEPATAPTAAELEEFAASYVETAANDPDAGFAMLTPAYQARSPEYSDFWGSVSNPEILAVTADPGALTVSYTYQYDFPGSGNQTERVTLFLVQEGDRLLIDDATSG